MNNNPSWILALGLVGVLIVALGLGGCSCDGESCKVGDPRLWAEATAVARSADLARSATQQALDYAAVQQQANGRATATAAAAYMAATGTAMAQQAAATATVLPYVNQVASAEASSRSANLALGVIGLGMFMVILFALGWAAQYWLSTQARTVRTPTGVLIRDGNTWIDPARQIGPAVTVQGGGDALWTVERWRHYILTGEALPPMSPRVALTDGGAGAEHYLAAAEAAERTKGLEAMFRKPGDVTPKARLQIAQGHGNPVRSLGGRVPRIELVRDESVVKEFEQRLLEGGNE